MASATSIARRVRELFSYDPLTGVFIRRVRLAQRHQVGDRADFLVTGGRLKGYRRVSFDSKRYLAHRVAWLYVHGVWPSQEIDHRNTMKGDNRMRNLRDVPPVTNAENCRRSRVTNKIGLLGVYKPYPDAKKWVARIQVAGKGCHIGCFSTPEAAHEAYVQTKRRLHEGCTL